MPPATIPPTSSGGFPRFLDYCRYKALCTGVEFEVRPHVVVICNLLELLFLGMLPDGKRHLVINIPPRFGKTFLLESFIEWGSGLMNDAEWIYTAYAAERAVKSVSKVKQIMSQEWYLKLFPNCKIKKLKGSDGRKDSFSTTAGGEIYGAGAKGSIIGFGAGKRRYGFAGAFIIDDPLKAQEARSELGRERAIEFLNECAKTRLNSSHAPIVIIMQRLHPDDPVGWIKKNESHLWHILEIPALKPDGTAEWEEAKSAQELLDMKEVDPFTFWTQYQQQPRHPGGTILKEEWWCYYTDLAEVMKRCDFFMMFADTAQKEKQANDYTVLDLWGFEGSERMYLIDKIKGKFTFPHLIEAFKAFWKKHGDRTHGKQPRIIWIEDKVSGTSAIQMLRHEGELPVKEWLPSKFKVSEDDKVSRTKTCSWLAYNEQVWLPDPSIAPWIEDTIDTYSAFTEDMSHSHDDDTDTFTMAGLTWKAMW